MDFEISHSFDASREEVAAALLDPEFQASLSDVGALRAREVLSQEEGSDGTVVRRTRCVLGVDLPGGVRAIIGNGDAAWVEEATWDPDSLRWEWVVIPEIAAELLSARGRIEISDESDGARRTVTGTVKVRVPIYGARVEGVVRDGLEHAYEEEADRLRAWLDGRS